MCVSHIGTPRAWKGRAHARVWLMRSNRTSKPWPIAKTSYAGLENTIHRRGLSDTRVRVHVAIHTGLPNRTPCPCQTQNPRPLGSPAHRPAPAPPPSFASRALRAHRACEAKAHPSRAAERSSVRRKSASRHVKRHAWRHITSRPCPSCVPHKPPAIPGGWPALAYCYSWAAHRITTLSITAFTDKAAQCKAPPSSPHSQPVVQLPHQRHREAHLRGAAGPYGGLEMAG